MSSTTPPTSAPSDPASLLKAVQETLANVKTAVDSVKTQVENPTVKDAVVSDVKTDVAAVKQVVADVKADVADLKKTVGTSPADWLEHLWSALGLAGVAVGASGASPHGTALAAAGGVVAAASAIARGLKKAL